MRLSILLIVGSLAAPVMAEETAAGRMAAFVTNQYLNTFTELRVDIARLEVLRACGDEETLIPFLDRIVAKELDLRRNLISEAEALEAENLPPVPQRRSLVVSILDAFSATDATARDIMIGAAAARRPAQDICDETRAIVLEQLETPQPTVLRN